MNQPTHAPSYATLPGHTYLRCTAKSSAFVHEQVPKFIANTSWTYPRCTRIKPPPPSAPGLTFAFPSVLRRTQPSIGNVQRINSYVLLLLLPHIIFSSLSIALAISPTQVKHKPPDQSKYSGFIERSLVPPPPQPPTSRCKNLESVFATVVSFFS